MTGFWSSETLANRLPGLIPNFDAARITQGSYELSLGDEAFITGSGPTKRTYASGTQVAIPPGQLAQLLTAEELSVPNDALGLISMKSEFKLRGLINVSGFHVDPGFRGKLLFSVYNASPNPIVLTVGQPTFLIWYAGLDQATADVYGGTRLGLSTISAQDVMKVQGDMYSPHALASRVGSVEGALTTETADRQALQTRIDALEQTVNVQLGRRRRAAEVVAALVVGLLLIIASVLGDRWLNGDDDADKSNDSTTSTTDSSPPPAPTSAPASSTTAGP